MRRRIHGPYDSDRLSTFLQRWVSPRRLRVAVSFMVLFGFLIGATAASPALADSGKKRVLVLQSYHKGYKWSDDITKGIENVLLSAPDKIDLHFEFMDSKKLFDQNYRDYIYSLYHYKFKDRPFDLIISADDNAFSFLLQNRDELFGPIPLVFCGVNYLDEQRLAGTTKITGVNEAASLEGGIDLLLTLHPELKRLWVVVDHTTTGKRVTNRLYQLIPDYADRLEIKLLQDLSIAELEARLREIPRDEVVLYTLFLRDRLNKFFEFDESIERVVNSSVAPVYVTWDFSLGSGAVGGLLTSGKAQGEAAAQMALRILGGEEVSQIPVQMQSPNLYEFDYQVLKQRGFGLSNLPKDSVLINKPDEFTKKYRDLLISGLLVAAALIAIILILMTNIVRRRRAEAELTRTNEELEERVRVRTKDVLLTNQQLNREIAEHKQATEQIHKLSLAIEQSSSSIVILDTEFKIEYANPGFTRMTGYTFGEVEGHYLSLLKGEVGDTDYAGKMAALQACQPWSGEFHNRRKDGSPYIEHAAMAPVLNEQGQLTHYISVNEDVTERKQANEKLNQALAEAVDLSSKLEVAKTEVEQAYQQLQSTQSQMLQQEKMASIGQLAAGVAHEVNNPIGFIAGNLRALGKYTAKLAGYIQHLEGCSAPHLPEELQADLAARKKADKVDYLIEDTTDLVEESLEGAERVREIVQGLKTFSRVDQAEHKPVNLNECIDSTIKIVWNEIKYKATIDKDYGDLPLVDCYPQQLNQVVMNMLVNAAQAIPEKGVIQVRTRSEGEQVVIEIEDNGCGMTDAQIGRIFEPFYTTKDVGKGTGLGMSIAYDIIQRHQGEIQVHSEVGKGTTFSIHLPVAAQWDEAEPCTQEAS